MPAALMGVAKSDFSQMSELIESVEHYTRIDLDLSDFEKQCNLHVCCHCGEFFTVMRACPHVSMHVCVGFGFGTF